MLDTVGAFWGTGIANAASSLSVETLSISTVFWTAKSNCGKDSSALP